MPATPYAKILVSVNVGPNSSGGLDVPSAATIDLTPESTVGWQQAKWEIYDYPEGWATPAGWTLGADGIIFFAGFIPPQITMPSIFALWGVWMLRLRVNEQVADDINLIGSLLDDTTTLSMLDPIGVRDIGARERFQFTSTATRVKGWLRSYQRSLRRIASSLFTCKLNANWTTTAAGAATIANAPSLGLSFPVLVGEVWEIDFQGTVQCSGVGGVKFAIAAPALSTIDGWYYSTTNALATPSTPQRITTPGALTATATHTVANVPAPDRIRATIVVAADGRIELQAASVTGGQTTTVFANATMRCRRAAGV